MKILAKVLFCYAKYDISTPLRSLDRFKEKFRVDQILDRLRSGEDIAYISDAGTPAICDPGALVVEALAAEGISISPIPGPSALTSFFVGVWVVWRSV